MVEDTGGPKAFGIVSAYPNPFNPATTVRYMLPQSGEISVKVYNANGQMVSVLDEGYASAGTHDVTWNARDNATGMYFVILEMGGRKDFRKLMLMK
jgi:hypothetical protein